MKTLAIDTATPACSVALFDGNTLVDRRFEVIGRGHAEMLVPMIAALPERGLAERIVVNHGPGSFTGIRIGLSVARALSFAWQARCFGYSTHQLVAAIASKDMSSKAAFDVIFDGGHGEYFGQHFDAEGDPTAPIERFAVDILAHWISADRACGSMTRPETVPTGIVWTEVLPDAGKAMLLDEQNLLAAPQPVYIRGPDAKPSAN